MGTKVATVAAEHRRKAEKFRRLASHVTTEWVREALLAQAMSHDGKAMLSEGRDGNPNQQAVFDLPQVPDLDT